MNKIKGNTIESENNEVNDKKHCKQSHYFTLSTGLSVQIKSQKIKMGFETCSNGKQAGSGLI